LGLHRERRFEQDASIARLALQLPILLRKRERFFLVPRRSRSKRALLLLMQLVAAQRCGVERDRSASICSRVLGAFSACLGEARRRSKMSDFTSRRGAG